MENINETTMNESENPYIITLDSPVLRGEQKIEKVTVAKPNAGTLRGVSLASLAQSDVDALIKVLPRISIPAITEQEASKLDPADLLQLGSEVASFLLPKAAKPDASQSE